MSAEVPAKVHTAIRLMYIGFVVTALDVVLSLLVLGRYTQDANAAKNSAALYSAAGHTDKAAVETAFMHHQNTMAGAMAIALVADVLGLACWVWLAMATRRGNGWTRIAGAVLLGIYSICTLLVLCGTQARPGPAVHDHRGLGPRGRRGHPALLPAGPRLLPGLAQALADLADQALADLADKAAGVAGDRVVAVGGPGEGGGHRLRDAIRIGVMTRS